MKSKKRGRIIIRNLSYKIDEETIRNVFESYGNIQEINILKRSDGKAKGVAFIQYNNNLSALKAIKECNMKIVSGRPIAVDLAIPKNKYEKNDTNEATESSSMNLDQDALIKEEDIKCEPMETELSEDKFEPLLAPKEEPIDDLSETEAGLDNSDIKDEYDFKPNSDSGLDDDSECDSEESNSGSSELEEDHDSSKKDNFSHNPVSKDVMEGKTLFLRNLSLQISEQEVIDVLSKYGSLKHVVFCKDKATGRFKGSAFAQFKSKDSAMKCIEASEDPLYKEQFSIAGRRLIVSQAISRGEVSTKASYGVNNIKKKEVKDKRNIYLAREGVIREGTRAAIDVSKSDLALRRTREIIKRRMLANFNTFVSPLRLFICNLPLHLNDKDLKTICKNYTADDAVITECRIMRNLFELDESGLPLSKGHGFVTFKEHKHALEALRNINNNPDIFDDKRRPVVEFSLENRAAVKAKQNRVKISKERNQKKETETLKEGASQVVDNMESSTPTGESMSFMGSKYDPNKKGLKALHSHIGPKIRHRDRSAKKNQSGTEGKITRNQMNHQIQRSLKGSKRGKGKAKQGKSKALKGKNKKKSKGTSAKKNSNISKGKKKKKFLQ